MQTETPSCPPPAQCKPLRAPEGFIRKSEACTLMGCQTRTIDNWMKKKMIPYYKFGRAVFFKAHELRAAIEQSRVN